MEIVYIIVGIIIGGIIGYLIVKSKGGNDSARVSLLEEENNRLKSDIATKDEKVAKLSSDITTAVSARDVMQTKVDNLSALLESEKTDKEKVIADYKEVLRKQEATAKEHLSSAKEQAERTLNDVKTQFLSQIDSQKKQFEGQIESSKKQYEDQLSEFRSKSESAMSSSKADAEKQRKELIESNEKALADTVRQYEEQIRNIRKQYTDQLESSKNHYEQQLDELRTKSEQQLQSYKTDAERQRKELGEAGDKALSETIRQYETLLAEMKEQYAKQLQDLKAQQMEQMEQQMTLIKEQMNTASEKILKERSEQLSEKNKEALASILNPLKDGITQMKDAVEKSGQEHKETMVRLDATIKHSIEQSREVGERADKLAQALTGENKTQGNFGELRLKQLLEDMGLEEGTQFEEQATMRDSSGRAIYDEEDGHRIIPDIILHFPDERDVIIDSKMSFKAFEDYHNAENDVQRQESLTRHIASVRQHVNELSRKNYSAYIKEGRGKLDFVLMYVFSESALQLALMNEPTLWKEAYDKGVIITGSQNLYMMLRVLEMTWRQVKQIENQEQMMKTANMVVDRVQMFYERFLKVDEMLTKTQKAFEEVKSVSGPSGQSIEVAAKKLIKYGAKSNPKRKYQLKNAEDDTLLLEEDIPALEEETTETTKPEPTQKVKSKPSESNSTPDDGSWAESFLN